MALVKIRNANNDGWINVGGGNDVIQQDAEPTPTYPGQLWVDTDAEQPDVGGAMVLLESKEASNDAYLTFTDIPAFSTVRVIFENIVPSSTNNDAKVQIGYGGTPTYVTSYYGNMWGQTSGGGSYSDQMSNIDHIRWSDSTYGVDAGYGGVGGWMEITGFGVAKYGFLTGMSAHVYSGYWYQQWFGGWINNNGIYTALRVYFGAGNVLSGRVSIYGMKTS